MPKQIAVLFHKREKRHFNFAIKLFEQEWRRLGFEVKYYYGMSRKIEADILIPQIDLTSVPKPYVDFINRFDGIILNRAVTDISKSTISRHRLGQHDQYAGKVIVKSNRNALGFPEWRLSPTIRQIYGVLKGELNKTYHIFNDLSEVPERYFSSEEVIVERFVPEYDNGHYFLRMYFFLGDSGYSVRIKSREQIVKDKNSFAPEAIETPEELLALRARLGFDYGKFDYLIENNNVVLIDANKTPAGSVDRATVEMDLQVAKGILSFL